MPVGPLFHPGDPVQHRPLKIQFQERADCPGQPRVHTGREVERHDLAVFEQLADRRQRRSVVPIGIGDWVIGGFGWTEHMFHIWVVIEQGKKAGNALHHGRPQLGLDPRPVVVEPALDRLELLALPVVPDLA